MRSISCYIAPLPGVRQFCLRTYIVGRPVRQFPDRKFSASILISCRNETGNIENAILRMPGFGSSQAILFVEGNSSDGTFEECERVRDAYRDRWDIKVLKQDGGRTTKCWRAKRGYFGSFDPFGDFDLIFGAAKQNLKIIETPIHYKARSFGETRISRFRDGWPLLKMVGFAYRKLNAI